MRDYLRQARGFEAELVEMRRDIHRHPELAFEEHRTAGVAADAVGRLGFQVRRGLGGTGVAADLRTGDGPTVALRADMDALPIDEVAGNDYRSITPGVMHACGHDAHTAMLIGAARLLTAAAREGELPSGTVRLLFQPAEERADDQNRSGASHLVAAGAMDGVSAVFALHVAPHLAAGMVLSRAGPIMAGSDTFTAHVHGSSSHGARPDAGVDAIVLAAHVVMAAQNAVSRRIAPLDSGVLTIGTIRGGTAENIVADQVSMDGTLRYFDPEVRLRLRESLAQALAVADALGGAHRLDLRDGYPPTVNDVDMTAIALEAARGLIGPEATAEAEPMMGTEDFAILLGEAPGALLWLGAAPPDRPRELHRPDMDIDESVLPVGSAVLAACATRILERRPG